MNQDQPKPSLKQALRKMVPESLLREREMVLRLGPKAGAIYARLRLLDSLGIRSHSTANVSPAPRSFLFVCFGNIMRSPMAEAMFRKSILDAGRTNVRASSAGLHAIPGTPAHPRALAVAAEIGIPLTDHRAQLLTRDLVVQADAIFAMDYQNKAELLALYPDARERIVMLSAYADGAARWREIADPYLGNLDTTRRCYNLLQTCIGNLARELAAQEVTPRVPVQAEGN